MRITTRGVRKTKQQSFYDAMSVIKQRFLKIYFEIYMVDLFSDIFDIVHIKKRI